MMKLGTKWVGRREGSTVHDLMTAMIGAPTCGESEKAYRTLDRLNRERGVSSRTNLELTGFEITPYDEARIALCE